MNMNKEYRRELAQLDRVETKILTDLRKVIFNCTRAEIKLETKKEQAEARYQKEIDKLDRRRAILNGRLS